jgi:hypothetical protein
MKQQPAGLYEQPEPPNMDVDTRNRRLLDHLAGIGLFVEPVCSQARPKKVDHLRVSVAIPEGSGK